MHSTLPRSLRVTHVNHQTKHVGLQANDGERLVVVTDEVVRLVADDELRGSCRQMGWQTVTYAHTGKPFNAKVLALACTRLILEMHLA